MKIKMRLELSTLGLIIKIVLMSLLLGFIGMILAAILIPASLDFLLDFYYFIAILIMFILILKNIINNIVLETEDFFIKSDASYGKKSDFLKEFEKEREERI